MERVLTAIESQDRCHRRDKRGVSSWPTKPRNQTNRYFPRSAHSTKLCVPASPSSTFAVSFVRERNSIHNGNWSRQTVEIPCVLWCRECESVGRKKREREGRKVTWINCKERKREKEGGGDDPLDKKLGGTINVVNGLYLIGKYRYWERGLVVWFRLILFENRLHRLIVLTLVRVTCEKILLSLFNLDLVEFRMKWYFAFVEFDHSRQLISLRNYYIFFTKSITIKNLRYSTFLLVLLQKRIIWKFLVKQTTTILLKMKIAQIESDQLLSLSLPLFGALEVPLFASPRRTWSETLWISIPVSFF